ncbi:CHAT domain-containing protein [Mycena galopus ATCC 62051]|nr:CHAT domain-containing protein [Mycena galopus ATCC 62051]
MAFGSARWDVNMLEKSIICGEELLTLIPTSNEMRRNLANLLLELYQDRFELKQNATDLDLCIQLCREELDLESTHPYSSHRQTLASLIIQRFKLDPDHQNLAEAIDLYTDELACCPASDPVYYTALNDLAHALDVRFEYQGNQTDIDRKIELYQQALDYTRPDSRAKIDSLNNLAFGLLIRFTNFGQEQDQVDLNRAIILYEQALSLRSANHHQRLNSLDGLGQALKTRFEQQKDRADINLAVNLHQEALNLCPRADTKRAMCLNTLAKIIHTRFTLSGDSKDLDHVINLYEEALKLHASTDPACAMSLTNLALAVKSRFEQRGDMRDIDITVELNRKALALCSNSHRQNRPMLLNNLAIAVHTRGIVRGQKRDIDEAIQRHREALLLLPENHSNRPTYLLNLAGVLKTHFRQLGNMVDMDEAIKYSRQALSLCPPTHSKHGLFLNSLANNLLNRFDVQRNSADNEEALQYAKEGMRIFPSPHPYYRSTLEIYTAAQQNKIDSQSTHSDIDQVIQLHRDILQLFSSPHPDRGRLLGKLGQSLMVSYQQIPHDSVIAEAMLVFEEAAKYTSCPPLARFNYAKYWAKTANQYNHPSALKAYSMAINYLPMLAALDLNLQYRQEMLANLTQDNLLSDAAICAISAHKYEDAVQLLEAGRSIFWSQALRLRTPFDVLDTIRPDLSAKLAQLSRQLEQASFRDTSRDLLTDIQVISMESEGNHCRQLNKEWEDVIKCIQLLPGFEDFMQPKSISTLKKAAVAGPIVVLTTTDSTCFALIVTSTMGAQCLELPGLMLPQVHILADLSRGLSNSISNLGTFLPTREHGDHLQDLSESEARLHAGPEGYINVDPDDALRRLLAELWKNIVKPVFDVLNLEATDPPRLWWCPTGQLTFLPLHAAGIYGPDITDCISDYVVSSYTPTLTALLDHPPHATASFKITAIIQPETPGSHMLPGAREELKKIVQRVPSQWLTALGDVTPATIKPALLHLEDSQIMHFACHGTQDFERPLASGLILTDGRLKVSEIMRSPQRDNALDVKKPMSLAFLSACETAKGDNDVPDEAMHLAASLLFAGFCGVVATLWTMNDLDGPKIADTFYEHLFKNCDPHSNPPVLPDLTQAAKALHLAVAKLRKEPDIPFKRWVPFVHYGF